MVREEPAPERQLSLVLQYLAPPPEKNTFIHYVERTDCDLVRSHTEPHSGTRYSLSGLEQLEVDSEDGDDFGSFGKSLGRGGVPAHSSDDGDEDDSGEGESGEAPAGSEAGWQQEEQPETEWQQHTEQPPRRPPHDVWVLEGRKLRGKDTRQSHVFSVTMPEAAAAAAGREGDAEGDGSVEFVVMLRPKIKNKRRGGGSFAASEGKGYVEIKCTVQIDMQLALSVEVGHGGQPHEGLPPFCVLHNFAEDAVCKLPAEWDFWEEVDPATGNLSVGFHAEPRGLQVDKAGVAFPEAGAAFAEDNPQLAAPWLSGPVLLCGDLSVAAAWDGAPDMWAGWVPCGWVAPVVPVMAAGWCEPSAPQPAADPAAGETAGSEWQ